MINKKYIFTLLLSLFIAIPMASYALIAADTLEDEPLTGDISGGVTWGGGGGGGTSSLLSGVVRGRYEYVAPEPAENTVGVDPSIKYSSGGNSDNRTYGHRYDPYAFSSNSTLEYYPDYMSVLGDGKRSAGTIITYGGAHGMLVEVPFIEHINSVSYKTCFGDIDIGSYYSLAIASDSHKPNIRKLDIRDGEAACDTIIPYNCPRGHRINCERNSQAYTWDCMRVSNGGGDPKKVACSIAVKKISAECSTVRNQCLKGTLGGVSASKLAYSWTCLGQGGGDSEKCIEKIPQVVDGNCGTSVNTCTKGSVTNQIDGDKLLTWNCSAENGGKTAACSIEKPYKGKCGVKHDDCLMGTSTRASTYSSKYVWACEGVGPDSTDSCTENIVSPGVCSKTVQNKCTMGTLSSPKTDAKGYIWTCLGMGGGADTECRKDYPATDGICSSSHYRCGKGEGVNQLKTTNIWSWSCPGQYGGKTTQCTESMGVKVGSCSDVRNECNIGTPIGISEDASLYKWTCLGPNNGGNEQCQERKKAEGVCSEEKNKCISGDLSSARESRLMWLWSCKGVSGGKSESCSLPKDGTASSTAVCSTSHYACTSGKATGKLEDDKQWSWTCDGGKGGKDASCKETKTTGIDDGTGTGTGGDGTGGTGTGGTGTGGTGGTGNGTGVGGEIDCKPTDMACLLKKCKGNPVCIAALNKCKPNDLKCINAGLGKNGRYGPGFPENNGACSTKVFSCVRGTHYDMVRDVDSYKWNCLGKKGGNDAICKVDKPKDAICSTKKPNTCDIGTLGKKSETTKIWSWSCLGIGGGKTEKCLMDIVPLNGICSSLGMACETGKSSAPKLTTDWWEWTCAGSYGGTSTTCYKEVKGACAAKHYSCAAGRADSKYESDAGWSWKCRGANGDLTVSCVEPRQKVLPNVASSTATTTKPTLSTGTSTASSTATTTIKR